MTRVCSWLLCLSLWLTLATAASAASVAVLPFANTGGTGGPAWLGQGIAQNLTYKLSHLGAFQVADIAAVQRATGGEVPEATALPGVAQALQVDVMVTGAYSQQGDQITIQAHFLRADGSEMGADSGTSPASATGVFDLQDRIALKLLKVLKAPILSDNERLVFGVRPTKSLSAYEAATRAGVALNTFLGDLTRKEHLATAGAAYQQAIKLDSYYAEAFGGLGLVQLLQHQYAAAYKSSQHSVELFSELSEGYAVLGRASYELKKLSQAQAAASRSLRTHTSPLYFAIAQTAIGLALQNQGKLKDAADRYRVAVGRHSVWPEPYLRLARLYEQAGQKGPAANTYDLYLRSFPGAEDAEQVRAALVQLRAALQQLPSAKPSADPGDPNGTSEPTTPTTSPEEQPGVY